MYKDVIGIVGGMGSYATADFFERILDAFPAEKEWDRPRVLIDNNCTMPSRVRAFLYDENKEQLISELEKSATGLINLGVTKLIFACNTSHLFLKEVYKLNPQIKQKTIDIIETLSRNLKDKRIKEAYILATEGTIESKVYEFMLSQYGIKAFIPNISDYQKIRFWIESVKTKDHLEEATGDFANFIEALPYRNIILACTELPILYSNLKLTLSQDYNIHDPLQAVIDLMKIELK